MRQGRERRKQVGDRGRRESIAECPPRAFDLSVIRINLEECAAWREGWRSSELQREVEPLAEQQHAVGLREHFGERVFETMIPRSTKLAEAPSFGKPIIHYDKYCGASAAYELLAQEFVARIEPKRIEPTKTATAAKAAAVQASAAAPAN